MLYRSRQDLPSDNCAIAVKSALVALLAQAPEELMPPTVCRNSWQSVQEFHIIRCQASAIFRPGDLSGK